MKKENTILPIDINLYAHRITVTNLGQFYRTPSFYAVFNNNAHYIKDSDVNSLAENIIKFIAETAEYKRTKELQFKLNFPVRDSALNTCIDGYFGRPAIHHSTIVLKPLQTKVKKIFLKQLTRLVTQNKLEDKLKIE